jgi:hypothetical protein
MRVLAHAHSHYSHDSHLALSDWTGIARELGVGTVLLTDHEETGWDDERFAEYVRDCRRTSTPDVTLVPGIEFSQEGRHLLCYGLRTFPKRPSPAAQLAKDVRAQGRWLCLAHPAKYRWRYSDEILASVDAVEVWNSKWIYDGMLGPHPRTLGLAPDRIWMAGQDVHKPKHLSRLFLETQSDDVLTDLAARRYVFVAGDRRADPAALASPGAAGIAQSARTIVLRHALRSYRWMRRVRTG